MLDTRKEPVNIAPELIQIIEWKGAGKNAKYRNQDNKISCVLEVWKSDLNDKRFYVLKQSEGPMEVEVPKSCAVLVRA